MFVFENKLKYCLFFKTFAMQFVSTLDLSEWFVLKKKTKTFPTVLSTVLESTTLPGV